MSIDEADLVRRLQAVAEQFDMPTAPPAEDVQRGRRRVHRNWATVGVAAAVVLIAAVGGLAAGAFDGKEETRPSPVERPTTPSSTSSPSSTEAPRFELQARLWEFGRELDALLVEVPGWDIITDEPFPANYDYAFNGPCSGDWGDGSVSGGDGGTPPPGRNGGGFGLHGFATEARASDALTRFVENLESCKATVWRTRSIAQTGAVLASSAQAVTWIVHSDRDVHVLQVRTSDGVPPIAVQVAVAEWIVDYNEWQNEN